MFASLAFEVGAYDEPAPLLLDYRVAATLAFKSDVHVRIRAESAIAFLHANNLSAE
jgi:hypothetical protein